MPLDVLPDAELVVTTYLRTHSEVGGTVMTDVPTGLGLRVQRIGGPVRVPRRLDAAHLQVEAWGGTKQQARDLAAKAHAALWAAGTTVAGAVITGVEDTLGLSWLPDPVTNRARYVFGVSALIHPA